MNPISTQNQEAQELSQTLKRKTKNTTNRLRSKLTRKWKFKMPRKRTCQRMILKVLRTMTSETLAIKMLILFLKTWFQLKTVTKGRLSAKEHIQEDPVLLSIRSLKTI
jgi:hypothetical protein